ncbi:hypothetical protein [Pseudaestuariivita sp.]|uniref:hypothetical protein n=1 Tax=Pseudaestuariivita sp. TaxID=2211669 RepID=UPI00405A2D20
MKYLLTGASLLALMSCTPTATVQKNRMPGLYVPAGVVCVEADDLERNDWLRDETPEIGEVIKAYASRGLATQESKVYRSYKAWWDAGFDHARAADYYGPGYLEAASCWVPRPEADF